MKIVYDIQRKKGFDVLDMFMHQIDLDVKGWNIEDLETGENEIYIQDKNILRKMYKLKNLFEKQRTTQQQQRPNSNNWNFGSVPASLLKKQI